MPANSTHPEYDDASLDWRTVRDVIVGESAIKAGGERYLPRIQSHTDEEYDLYLERASFFNATARTAEGYLGLLFRRPPFIKLPDSTPNSPRSTPSPGGEGRGEGVPFHAGNGNASSPLRGENGSSATPNSAIPPLAHDPDPQPSAINPQPLRVPQPTTLNPQPAYVSGIQKALLRFLADADLFGTSFNVWAKNVANEVVTVGRGGSYIDWQNAGHRAFVACFGAEEIINWRVERVYERLVPTLIVLRETAALQDSEDQFLHQSGQQFRVLRLVPTNMLKYSLSSEDLAKIPPGAPAFSHIVELWRQSPARDRHEQPKWQLFKTCVPKRLGKPLPLIPFVFHGPRHSQPEIDKSPLSDLIAVNLDHYRLDADYKHGLHYTALPTAWVSGFDRASNLKIGSSAAWVTETTGAAAGFLEFRGQGLTSFERAMDRDERLMAVLGSRLLEDQKKVGETAEAIELRQSGENSILGSIALSLSESLTQVLRWVYWWNSFEDTPDLITDDQALVRVNTDFSTKGIASTQLEAIVKAWQAGAISQNTMLELFRKGEILPDGRTNQEEISLLATNRNGTSEP